jgi:O-acetyl-ADP-ribose deacetylase (regulator of RNase III)
MISTVYVVSHEVAESVSAAHVVPEPNMFFRPTARDRLTSTLSLADGDMFFSRLQTLTISVNVVGIMGKGLASRAKYQFPDVYVRYQDLCRRKALKMGKPALYKREASLDDELADEPSTLKMSNASKWFLLFPTKRHWREDSDLAGIEAGLVWLVENYEKLGMESLAIPALGCGLGNLDWRDVGPIMCRHLAKMTIPCCIYLPREHPIPPEYRSPDYLLAKR